MKVYIRYTCKMCGSTVGVGRHSALIYCKKCNKLMYKQECNRIVTPAATKQVEPLHIV